MTVRSALRHAEELEIPRVEAELLLGQVLGVSRSAVAAGSRRRLGRAQEDAFEALLRRRVRQEPVQYILGEWGFRRLRLKVDRRALIPRPETEMVVERCLVLLADAVEPDVLDVGTGTGAIALAIAQEHPDARVAAIEVSPEAVELARENVLLNDLAERVVVHERDLRQGLGSNLFDLVVSNPPYVRPNEVGQLAPEIREWEPSTALLDAGQSTAIVGLAQTALRPGGRLVLEAGDGRAAEVAEELERSGYDEIRISDDLTGRERVVEGRRR